MTNENITILYYGDEQRGNVWADIIANELPEVNFLQWSGDLNQSDLKDINYLIAWKLPENIVELLPNLKILFSVGAGVDQLGIDKLPKSLRVVRMIEPGIITTMTEYVSASVLAMHRDFPFYIANQRKGIWQSRKTLMAYERKVAIMGLGELGKKAIKALKPFGFKLYGWSRSEHKIDGVTCFHGNDGFDEFLANAEILVCLLPLTKETNGILCRETFDKMPKGAKLINVARGGHLNQEDLLSALEEGQISNAILDVTNPEPLPENHPFYTHPAIILTPHTAGVTRADSAIYPLMENLRRELSGEKLVGEVNLNRGY